METAAFIAEAVGVTPASLRVLQRELIEPSNTARNEVILASVNSGRRIVDAIRTSFEAELTFDVEPTKENIEPLAQLASLLEPFKPAPWETPYELYEPSQSTILEKQAEANALLPTLAEMNINIFLGTYPASRQIPRYDMDEGCMYVKQNFSFEPVQVTLVIVSDMTATHLVRKPDDMYVEQSLDTEIPF